MASTPRPLDWKPAVQISADAQDAVKTVQFEDGNGHIMYKKNKKIQYKNATVTQGHWESMSLGTENIMGIYPENIKQGEAEQAVFDDIFVLLLTPANRPFLFYRKVLDTGPTVIAEDKQIISYIV